MVTKNFNLKPSICFVSPEAYGALFEGVGWQANGAELQQATIARHLAGRGYDVSFVTETRGQSEGLYLDGIRVFNAYDSSKGLRYIRLIHPRMTGLWRAMNRCDADIYFQRTNDITTGIAAAFCRAHHKRFIYSVASDANCVPDLPHLPKHERPFYRFGLRQADCVVAQTVHQQELLRENFDRDSTVIPNCGPDEIAPATLTKRTDPPKRLLWVGRWIRVKRLEMLLDVAERCGDVQIDIVGSPSDAPAAEYTHDLQERISTLPNVNHVGHVPHSEIGKFYDRAAALICTSAVEGFPNTFIEAWQRGLPVISTFDPDGVLTSARLGLVTQGAEGLVRAISHMFELPQIWRQMSARARQYFIANHSVDAIIPRFEKVFHELMEPNLA